MAERFAIVPSIEKQPSVATNRKRASLRRAELRFQICHIVVLVAKPLRFAEADAVDDAGVIQFITDHRVLFAEQRFE